MAMHKLLVCLVFACALQRANSQCAGATERMPYVTGTLADNCGPAVSSPDFTGGVGSLSRVGDLNGDGTDDFAYAQIDSAKVFVIFGQPGSTIASNPTFDGSDGFVLEGEQGEDFGAALAGGFDINSDGFDDFMVGSPKWNGGAGRAFIIFGTDIFVGSVNVNSTISSDGTAKVGVEIQNPIGKLLPPCADSSSDWELACPSTNDTNFGMVASSIGDVNDDGLDDLAIGSNGGDVGVVLIFGRGLGVVWEPVLTLSDKECDGTNCARINTDTASRTAHAVHLFGNSVSGGCDFNDDGIKDFIIGAPGAMAGTGGYGAGVATMFMGTDIKYEAQTKIESLDGTTGFLLRGVSRMRHGHFGAQVQALEDINGDDIGDFAISIPDFQPPGGEPQRGQVVIIFGWKFEYEDSAALTLDGNPRGVDIDFDTPMLVSGARNCKTEQGADCSAEESLWKGPHTANVKCASGDAATGCSGGFVVVGKEKFGMRLDAGDLNADGHTDLLIGGEDDAAATSTLHIVWGQAHTANFTVPAQEAVQGNSAYLSGSGPKNAICSELVQESDQFENLDCAYADADGVAEMDYISKINSATTDFGRTFAVLGDVNKDRIADFGFLGTVDNVHQVFVIPGRCNAGGGDDFHCVGVSPLPDGCQVPLSRLIPGFVDDDFLDWARGYIRYVMEQMTADVKAAWDDNMLDKGFYVGDQTASERCWCSPRDPATNQFYCFEFDDLVCSGAVDA